LSKNDSHYDNFGIPINSRKIADNDNVSYMKGRTTSDPAFSLNVAYIPRNALAKKTAIWALVTGFPGP
jgi:hypothetical protein